MTSPHKYLILADPVLGAVIGKIKLPKAKPRANHFQSLVEEIISQQLSGRVADVITERFVRLFKNQKPERPFPKPKNVLRMLDENIRAAGLSYQKIGYIKNIARAVENRELVFEKLKDCENEEAIEILTKIKGIGRWTAEMFLMFTLGREDIFSYGDLGLKNAMQRLYGLRKHPSKKTAERISKKWKPHRTLACRYLWASLELNQDSKIFGF
jgi:DNA-3-methyladenine glycosylase II